MKLVCVGGRNAFMEMAKPFFLISLVETKGQCYMTSVRPAQGLSHIETTVTPLMPTSGTRGGRRDGLVREKGGCRGKAFPGTPP